MQSRAYTIESSYNWELTQSRAHTIESSYNRSTGYWRDDYKSLYNKELEEWEYGVALLRRMNSDAADIESQQFARASLSISTVFACKGELTSLGTGLNLHIMDG